MSGNMHRWMSNDSIPAGDSVSYCSTALSDTSDDRIRAPDIGQRMKTLLDEQLFTDVKFSINCGQKPKPTILAHKAILAVGSEKFKEMLFGRKFPSGEVEIQINQIPFNAFRNVVEYLYTDDVIFENDQSVLETLSAASQFEVQALVDKCESYIASVELTVENACTKFQLACKYKLESLKGRCMEFIQENTGAVLRSSDFLAANSSTVRSICKLEKFNLRSEVDLLNGLIRWVESRPDFKTSNTRSLVEPFLKHLRLLTVPLEEFANFVQKHENLFTVSEATNIIHFLSNPYNTSINLPSWCKRGDPRCMYHILPAPQQKERRFSPRDNYVHKLPIFLKSCPTKSALLEMTCALEMRCFKGRHQINGLRLLFDDPVHEASVISHLMIQVDVEPSKYHFEEHLRIANSKEVEVSFTSRLLAKRGDVVRIKAQAKNVRNYNFLQFDEEKAMSQDSPFVCTVGSIPKGSRLFFISEVLYQNAQSTSGPRRGGNPRRPR